MTAAVIGRRRLLGFLHTFIESSSKYGGMSYALSPRCQGQTKCFYSSVSEKNGKWDFDTRPFGRLIMRTGEFCDIQVNRIDPQKYPLQNRIFVDLAGDTDPVQQAGCVSCQMQESELHITTTKNSELSPKKEENIKCSVHIPIKYDVDVLVTGNRNIEVSNLENDNIKIETESGNCTVTNIQTDVMQVVTSGGDVICHKVLQGNPQISTTGKGSVRGDRAQGLTLDVQTEAGDIDFKAIYADRSEFTTQTGDIHFKSCHRSTTVNITQEGNLTIGSQDGNLDVTVNKGNIEVYAMQHEHVQLRASQGNITVKVPESVGAAVTLEGREVVTDEDLAIHDEEKTFKDNKTFSVSGQLHHINSDISHSKNAQGRQTGRAIHATAPEGTISLRSQDWLASLNLKANLTDLT